MGRSRRSSPDRCTDENGRVRSTKQGWKQPKKKQVRRHYALDRGKPFMDSQGRSVAKPLVVPCPNDPAPEGRTKVGARVRPPLQGGLRVDHFSRGSAALHPWLHSVAPSGQLLGKSCRVVAHPDVTSFTVAPRRAWWQGLPRSGARPRRRRRTVDDGQGSHAGRRSTSSPR